VVGDVGAHGAPHFALVALCGVLHAEGDRAAGAGARDGHVVWDRHGEGSERTFNPEGVAVGLLHGKEAFCVRFGIDHCESDFWRDGNGLSAEFGGPTWC